MSTRELETVKSRPASSSRNEQNSEGVRSRPTSNSRNSERTDDPELAPAPRLTVVESIAQKYKGDLLLNKYHGKGESERWSIEKIIKQS